MSEVILVSEKEIPNFFPFRLIGRSRNAREISTKWTIVKKIISIFYYA